MADWSRRIGWILRVVVILVIIGGGIGGFLFLSSFYEEPERQTLGEVPVSVDVVTVEKGPVTITLTGLGTVRTPTRVAIIPEVQGRVVEQHENLREGGIVQQGDLLFALDKEEYQLTYDAHAAELAVLDAQLAELAKQRESLQQLLDVRRDLLAIAKRRLARTQTLYEQENVGTESEVDAALLDVTQTREQLVQQQNILAELPAREATLKARQQQVQRQLALDQLAIDRCRVHAPITGRIEEPMIEVGQRLSPASPVAYLVDDSDRELLISLHGGEVGRWLRFTDATQLNGWFSPPERVPVDIRWLGARQSGHERPLPRWQGTLDRIQAFDNTTRTVMAVVRIPADAGPSQGIPLVAGMFCEAHLPGRTLSAVAAVPRTAVNDDGTVFLAIDGKLRQRSVDVIHYLQDKALIGDELQPGEQVIVNRLSAPVFGMKVEVRPSAALDAVPVAD